MGEVAYELRLRAGRLNRQGVSSELGGTQVWLNLPRSGKPLWLPRPLAHICRPTWVQGTWTVSKIGLNDFQHEVRLIRSRWGPRRPPEGNGERRRLLAPAR